MNQEQLDRLGKDLEEALKDAAQACALPVEKTRVRGSKSY
jgi:hypothetical protein